LTWFTYTVWKAPCTSNQQIFMFLLQPRQEPSSNLTPCSPLKVNRCFGIICRLNLQGCIVNRARNRRESKQSNRFAQISDYIRKKDKTIPVIGVRRRSFHIFYPIGSQTAVRLSVLHACRSLNPRSFLVLISVSGWADLRTIVRLEGLGKWKNSMTSSRIKLATFRLVAECPNEPCYRVPRIMYYAGGIGREFLLAGNLSGPPFHQLPVFLPLLMLLRPAPHA
jgi:hypothetical protein